MADSKNTAHESATFEPFAWTPVQGLEGKELRNALFLNDARDVIDGAHTLMQLLAWDEDRRDDAGDGDEPSENAAPLLEASHRASLQRLLVASLGMLHARIEAQADLQ
jgi:hypothetical protein